MRLAIEMGGLPSITVMLHSSHPRMANEALVSLTILTAALCSADETLENGGDENPDFILVHRHLHTDLVINGVKKILQEPKFPTEIKANAATFIVTLLKVRTAEFKQMLQDLNFVQDGLTKDHNEKEGESEPFPAEVLKLRDHLENGTPL